MAPVSHTTMAERIARVLAGRALSRNAEGSEAHAGDKVDLVWREYLEDAQSILRTMREPDQFMALAGDPAVWERMVEAALAIEGGDKPVG